MIVGLKGEIGTGKTLQYLYEILLSEKEKGPQEVRMYVTEADLIRSKIDRENTKKDLQFHLQMYINSQLIFYLFLESRLQNMILRN